MSTFNGPVLQTQILSHVGRQLDASSLEKFRCNETLFLKFQTSIKETVDKKHIWYCIYRDSGADPVTDGPMF